jgi:hypothetical protein
MTGEARIVRAERGLDLLALAPPYGGGARPAFR